MCLWICMFFVVTKAQVETNVFDFKVNSQSKAEYRMFQWSVITQAGSGPLSITCTLCNQGRLISGKLFRTKSRLYDSCCAFSDRIIDNLSVNRAAAESFYVQIKKNSAFDLLPGCFHDTKPVRMDKMKPVISCLSIPLACYISLLEAPQIISPTS